MTETTKTSIEAVAGKYATPHSQVWRWIVNDITAVVEAAVELDQARLQDLATIAKEDSK